MTYAMKDNVSVPLEIEGLPESCAPREGVEESVRLKRTRPDLNKAFKLHTDVI